MHKKMAKQFPDSFIVDKLDYLIENIKLNTLVKVCANQELFWVIVRGFMEDGTDKSMIGEIHDILIRSDLVNFTDLIVFNYENIYEVSNCLPSKFGSKLFKLNNHSYKTYQIKPGNMKVCKRQLEYLLCNDEYINLALKLWNQTPMVRKYYNIKCKWQETYVVVISSFVMSLSSKTIIQQKSIEFPMNKYKKQLLINLIFFSGVHEGLNFSLFLGSFEHFFMLHILKANYVNIIVLIENVTRIQNAAECIQDMFYYLTAQIHDPTNDKKMWDKLSLGSLMYFLGCSVSNILKRGSESSHAKKVQAVFDDKRISDADSHHIIYSKLKQWRKNVVQTGKKFLCEILMKMESSIKDADRDINAFYILAKFCEEEKSYEKAKMYYLMAIFDVRSFYMRTLALRKCSNICHKYLREHSIALKLLKYAHKICCIDKDNIITPTFALDIYFQQKQKIQKKLRRLKCTYCKTRKRCIATENAKKYIGG
eukprot:446827_1